MFLKNQRFHRQTLKIYCTPYKHNLTIADFIFVGLIEFYHNFLFIWGVFRHVFYVFRQKLDFIKCVFVRDTNTRLNRKFT